MMKKFVINFLRPALFLLAGTLAVPAFSADESATMTMEIMAQKVKADKKLLVANNMNLTDEEAKAFWPIYDAYQQDLYKINQRVANLINEYALEYNKGAILNDKAKKLLDEAIDIELAEANLKKSYVPKLNKVLPAAKAARYIQIENKIRALIRYQLADAIPLAK
jgi:hypothetical protein